VIISLRRTFASRRMTLGQMSMGETMCSTMEPPLQTFQSKGEQAVPEGQYPLVVEGDDVLVDGIPHRDHVVLGRDIAYGLSTKDGSIFKQKEAKALFYPAILGAIKRGDDVLLDVVNPRFS
jgi:hypothetical protein